MTKDESDLIIAEQNKSTEEILKAVAKVKSDYHELCKLKDMRIAELEQENAELKEELNYAKTHCLFHSDCPTQKELASIKLKVEALSGDIPWSELKDKSEVIGQLTKAKIRLEQLVSEITVGELEVDPNVLQQAENFLKEE